VAVSKPKTNRLYYLLLVLPFILAFVSWWGFPVLAQWLSMTVFGYEPLLQPAGWLWYAAVMLYYSWFTFLGIGVGGLLAVSAWLSRRHAKRQSHGALTACSGVQLSIPGLLRLLLWMTEVLMLVMRWPLQVYS